MSVNAEQDNQLRPDKSTVFPADLSDTQEERGTTD
jgi:hypothetical protein